MLHFDRSIRLEIPALAMVAPLALRPSKMDRAGQAVRHVTAMTAVEKDVSKAVDG
jgi:hypothetical protein